MGQIVKRRKKGRPPKSDLSARELPPPSPPPGGDLRRSHRRRNVKYVFDLDDYFDEDELFAEDDEDQRRRENKIKLLLKLESDSQGGRHRRAEHAPSTSASSSDEDNKPSKKRKIGGYLDGDNEEYNYNDDEEHEEEVRERKAYPKVEESPPGPPPAEASPSSGLPMPDKKALELILDKLQKKDIYGVYAEPVDPEELPDYHDMIENPMDFATVRNKLKNGSYATFEQFESDIFLICSNAMQYNSADTVYHKQARTIQEMAKRKFEKIKLNMEREIKSEQKMRSGSILTKQIKRSASRTVHEPIGSDFSSGATLATARDNQNVENALLQALGSEKLGGSVDRLVEGNSFFSDNNIDKAEESFPGKGPLSRFGRKSIVNEENRATYSMPILHTVASSDSVFSTFDGETKQLVPVGLYSDNSYARSLARFSATLGSVAWEVASRRIEQALPQGLKFGQGWVGEYEPPPTPVLVLENCFVKEPPFLAKAQPAAAVPRKLKNPFANLGSENLTGISLLEHKLPFLGSASTTTTTTAHQQIRGNNNIAEMKPSFFLSPRVNPNGSHNQSYQPQNIQSDKKTRKPVEFNGSEHHSNRQASRSLENDHSRPMDFSPKNMQYLPSRPSFKQHDNNGVAFQRLSEGQRVGNNKMDGNTIVSSPNLGQGLSDPVQLMRQMSEKAHNQQKHPNQSSPDGSQNLPSPQNFSGSDPNNAALAAARAWMSVGTTGGNRTVTENGIKNQMYYADSLYNSQMSRFLGDFHVWPDKNISTAHGFVPQGSIPMMVGGDQMMQQRMIFPHLGNGDLSRLQLQSTWRSTSPQMHSRQIPSESLPPDLNIGFQSSGSPGRPSSGVRVDSQQPDLALQL